MKFNTDYVIKKVGDEALLVRQSKKSVDYSKVITLNPTSLLIVEGVMNNLSIDDITEKMVAEYDVSKEKAKQDIIVTINQLKTLNIVYGD